MSLLCAATLWMTRAFLASGRVTSLSYCPCKAWSQVREFVEIGRKGEDWVQGPVEPMVLRSSMCCCQVNQIGRAHV